MLKMFILLLFFLSDVGQNPREHFGDKYIGAVGFIEHHQKKMHAIIEQEGSDYAIVIPIVFPELIRYNMYKDFFETKANELMYINNGSPLGFFSIGVFQLKPSFAENIETVVLADAELLARYRHIVTYKSTSEKEIRRERLARLKTYQWQLRYVAVMCRYIEKKYVFDENTSIAYKIGFFSSAYNHNFMADSTKIDSIQYKKFFPYGVNRENPFTYATVSKYFYYNDFRDVK